MSEGNGKTPEQVITAQRAVDAAQKQCDAAQRPLKELDHHILVAQAKVNAAREELAVATQEREAASEALADGQPDASKRHVKAATTHTSATAAHTVLQQRLDKLVAQRGPLQTAYEAASVAQGQAQTVLDDEMDGVELARCKFHLAQAQEQAVSWQKKVNEVADRRLLRQRRVNEATQRENQRRMAAQFRVANPGGTPGFERTRNSF